MDTRESALYIFRKLIYLLYLEIGALQPAIHPGLANKARLKTAFFQREKERQANELYLETEANEQPAAIAAPYEERTGLSLEDVHIAFRDGDWRNKFGGYNFGGPKWIKIAEVTQALKELIEQENWEEVEMLVHEIKGLKTNKGYLINQFERTERRRR
jgi:hypothetical protein